jgi:flagellar hook-basal body complex protein FliE
MSISPISSNMLEAAQKALKTSEAFSSGLTQIQGKTPMASFGDTLAKQISEQGSVALNPQNFGATATPPSTYKGVVLQMIEGTQSLHSKAGQAVQNVIKGDGSLHSAMIAMEEASVSFQLLVEMRNKVVDSLQELMRMQI